MDHADYEDNERIIKEHREKYGPPFPGQLPASMQKGSDMAPFFWIGYAIVFGLLALYFGMKAGG